MREDRKIRVTGVGVAEVRNTHPCRRRSGAWKRPLVRPVVVGRGNRRPFNPAVERILEGHDAGRNELLDPLDFVGCAREPLFLSVGLGEARGRFCNCERCIAHVHHLAVFSVRHLDERLLGGVVRHRPIIMTCRRIVMAHDSLPRQSAICAVLEVELLRRARNIPVERVGRVVIRDIDRLEVRVPT